jgi:AcrR family transcriptional regulator
MTVLENIKERAILEAAEKEFMIKGYEGAKTVSIAKAAGVTHAMLHYYYRTKENLFNKVISDKLTIMAQSIISSFQDRHQPFIERIKNGIEAHFDFLTRNPDLPRFVVNELISKPERISIIQSRVLIIITTVSSMQQELDEQIKAGKIKDIKITDLIVDIASINVFSFVALPILRTFAMAPYNSEKDFFEARKKENVKVIMNRLLKNYNEQ